jgi:hypothetical protein
VGVDGGDYHSVQVSAYPEATMTMTCPGNPPRVSQIPFDSVWLLNVLMQKNTHSGGAIYKGTQTFDPANPNLPMSPGQALPELQNSIAGAFLTPEMTAKLKEAQEALERIKVERGGRIVYTFEWELKPAAGAPAP